jgi:CheY-like chemotaxis protein
LEVKDTGQGISQQEQANLFKPFAQTRTGVQAGEGTGLGLAISRQFALLLGGSLQCDSEEGRGTTFVLELPVEVIPAVAMSPAREDRQVIGLAPECRGEYRLVCADDHPESCRLVREWLEPLGFDIRTAHNGQETLALWRDWQPHLIWLDMRMPEVDGYEVARRIKADVNVMKRQPALIALTASALDHERAEMLAAGCDDVIHKPMKAADLFDMLSRHLKLQFDYADDPPTEPSLRFETLVSAAQLTDIPADWLTELDRAANEIDPERAQAIIRKIADHDPVLARGLREMVRAYRFDQLRDLLQKVERTS